MAANIQELRHQILNIILKVLAVAGTPVMVILLSRFIPRAEWGSAIFYISAYSWIIWITFDQKLPYRFRAIGFILIPFALGLAAVVQEGISGSIYVWLLGFTVLAALLLGMNFGIGAIVVSVLAMVVSGYLTWKRIIGPQDSAFLTGSASVIDWLWTGVVWLLMATTICVSLNTLVQGMIAALEKERTLSGILTSDREQTNRRARELDRRLLQIRTAAEVSRTLSALLDPTHLLQQVVDLVQDRFGLYYVGVFLIDEKGDHAVLNAGTGEAGKEMMGMGYKLEVGGASMIGWTITNRQPRIALDIGREPIRFSNPLLPLTRSEMALPLISGEQVFGALTVQSTLPEAFDQDDIIVMQGIADSVATSLQNARLFEESRRNLQEIQALNRQYMLQAWRKADETPAMQGVHYENESYEGLEETITTKRFPILLRDQVIGQLSLDTDKKVLTPEEEILVQEVTTQAALAMENIRLLEESQRRASLERLLSNVVQNVRAQTDLEMILRSTVGELGKALGATDGLIFLTPEYLETDQTSPPAPGNGGNGSQSGQG
jgi:GAF domain-containing protein